VGYFSAAFDYKNYLFLTLGGRFETTSTYDPNLKVYFTLQRWVINSLLDWADLTDGKLRATYGQVASIPDHYLGQLILSQH
jgi:hypothetical protein